MCVCVYVYMCKSNTQFLLIINLNMVYFPSCLVKSRRDGGIIFFLFFSIFIVIGILLVGRPSAEGLSCAGRVRWTSAQDECGVAASRRAARRSRIVYN